MNAAYEDMKEASLLESLRGGDEGAFVWLVQNYHKSLIKLAMIYLQDEGLAEEVVQETWAAVLNGLDRFEKRSSLKTWIFTILTNRAKTRGQREKRTLSFSELENLLEAKVTVDPKRFKPPHSESFAGHWMVNPSSWRDIPEERFLAQETLNVIDKAISSLPGNQRAVIVLRDIEEFSSEEACNILGVSETNLRVLLHRARAKVREALETYLNLES